MNGPARLDLANNLVTTLEDARAWTGDKAGSQNGAICPCCDQLVKVYRRRMTSAMAVVLVKLAALGVKESARNYVHVQSLMPSWGLPSAIAASGDYAKLRFWGFIEQEEGTRPDGSGRNGYWRLTDAGNEFARGVIATFSHVLVYNNQGTVDTASQMITIYEAVGSKFSYDELMKGV